VEARESKGAAEAVEAEKECSSTPVYTKEVGAS